ncbi:uncharacterized protein FOMMEDRAFT_18374 [Fomitiporia mediterranea MF3/22]|uniref:uncharacterized protein n=1 Tax=Fomitiporia mediterranea (strain MF3/22) TaxID=694068 RepID=UPI0004407D76|nr:uncharacterized protein FOMMEDRAFT_18374 [Fomitiporia mediterranea MF3/22]EJD06219.1 hypothetical protein FOMMEDRAFT_18374 [Fomitiporia mediterranea MF3/22]
MDPRSQELEVVAELQNDVGSSSHPHPTTVRLRGQQFRPTRDFWLKDGVAGSDARFRGKDEKYYQWRQRKGRLELIREQEPDSAPVAVYHKNRRHFRILPSSRQPYLEIQPTVMETLDSLIVSFLLMEQKRRSKAV